MHQPKRIPEYLILLCCGKSKPYRSRVTLTFQFLPGSHALEVLSHGPLCGLGSDLKHPAIKGHVISDNALACASTAARLHVECVSHGQYC